MRKKIHQVIVSASDGDAITGMAISLRNQLRRTVDSEIFSYWRHGADMNSQCQPLEALAQETGVSLLVYHASIGHSVVSQMIRMWSGPIAVAYHNMTPSYFFRSLSDELASDLELGREDLGHLRDKAVISLADSEFNARELQELNYDNIHVVPAGFNPRRLKDCKLDARLLREMHDRFPNGYVVVVGQLLPHKRIEQAISAVHLLNSTHWGGIGLVLCGSARLGLYAEALSRYVRSCPMVDVHFAGHVTDEELSTYLAGASVLLTTSDHEGMCFPPFEAARAGVPVVGKGAGALPETIGDAALLLPVETGPTLIAEALNAVLTDSQLRGNLINRGFRRVEEFSTGDETVLAAKLLMDACS